MGDKTGIEWCDATWNPFTGCSHVSPGCDNCYAARLASGRLAHTDAYAGLAANGRFNGLVRLHPHKLTQPIRWQRPRTIFVNSTGDAFHEAVSDGFLARVFAVMAIAWWHRFPILTKRHGRMRALLSDPDFPSAVLGAMAPLGDETRHDVLGAIDAFTWPLPNVWLGVSVEDRKRALLRIDALEHTPAAVRFLSCEPLLGSLGMLDLTGIGWVIAGGESGPNARPMHPDWARAIRDACVAAGVPFFFKQHGEWAPLGPLYTADDESNLEEVDEAHMEAVALEVMDGKRVIQLESDGYIAEGHQPADSRTWLMARTGKKAAGRLLDGREWSEFPVPRRQPAPT